MRLNFVVLLFTLFTCLLYSCNNDELEIEKEYTFSNRFSEIMILKKVICLQKNTEKLLEH